MMSQLTPPVGSTVRIHNGGFGARGAGGHTGIVVSPETPSNNGASSGPVKVRITVNGREQVWRLNEQEYKLSILSQPEAYRADANLNHDPRSESVSTQYKRVLGVGAGGVGFYCFLALNRSLPPGVELHVWDADNFVGGLGHTRLPHISNPETKKVTLLKGFSQAVMGDRAINVYPTLFTGAECQEGDLVVDCSDMPLGTLTETFSRRSIWKRAQANGAHCIRVSYDGLRETVVVAQGLPLRSGKGGHGGYSAAPNLALSLMAGGVGALAVLRVLNGYTEHLEFQISLSEFFPEPAALSTEALPAPETVSEAQDDALPILEPETQSQAA